MHFNPTTEASVHAHKAYNMRKSTEVTQKEKVFQPVCGVECFIVKRPTDKVLLEISFLSEIEYDQFDIALMKTSQITSTRWISRRGWSGTVVSCT